MEHRQADSAQSSRFAAKLLFQFRVDADGNSGKRRTCEERIVNFRARSARVALAHAKRQGKAAEYQYQNSDGNTVHFEFIGILDLLKLGPEAEHNDVWYDTYDRLTPMERREHLIPGDDVLLTRALGKRV